MPISSTIARGARYGIAHGVKNGIAFGLVGSLCAVLVLGIDRGLVSEPALAFDGTTSPNTAVLTPSDGLRAAAHPQDSKNSALTALQYAAEQGQPVAQWKLGRMYADGDGVPRDDLRAFNYFSQIANSHPDEVPGALSPTLSWRLATTI
jgi:TPR repeat protein